MHANGCRWDERMWVYAAGNGQEAVLHWARANGWLEKESDEEG
jgi:hypothetical protein